VCRKVPSYPWDSRGDVTANPDLWDFCGKRTSRNRRPSSAAQRLRTYPLLATSAASRPTAASLKPLLAVSQLRSPKVISGRVDSVTEGDRTPNTSGGQRISKHSQEPSHSGADLIRLGRVSLALRTEGLREARRRVYKVRPPQPATMTWPAAASAVTRLAATAGCSPLDDVWGGWLWCEQGGGDDSDAVCAPVGVASGVDDRGVDQVVADLPA
jgi:hypothetical protein